MGRCLKPGTGEILGSTDAFKADQLSFWLSVSRLPLLSSFHSERGQMLWGSWKTEVALHLQQDPGWSNKDNWGQGHSRDNVPLKALCLFARVRCWHREEMKRGKLVREIFLQKQLHVCVCCVSYDLLVPRSIFCVRSNRRCTETDNKMSLSTMLFLHGCLFRLKCHCLCSFSWCLCWTLHTWIGLSKKQNKKQTISPPPKPTFLSPPVQATAHQVI